MILRTYLVLVLHDTHLEQPPTMTSTSDTTKPSSRDPRARRLKRVNHKGQEKRASPEDALRRKSIPRSAKIKTKISLHDSTTVKTPPAKAADGKPIAGRSPEEALRDSFLS